MVNQIEQFLANKKAISLRPYHFAQRLLQSTEVIGCDQWQKLITKSRDL